MTEILTRKEVSAFLKMSVRTIDYLVGTNQIPFSRIGKRGIRFQKSRLENWLEEREGIEFRHAKTKN
jgi:excisionase family DNA binding protein